jgi:hypothetical protein
MRRILSLAILAPIFATTAWFAGDANAANNDGYIYGSVTTRSGSSYTGFMRWGTQEAFWDDLFHSAKEELPFLEEFDDDGRRGNAKKRLRILGYRIDWDGGDSSGGRVFIARFGDIDSIEVTGDNDATITMRNGEEYEVSGYADDVGGEIHVNDESAGEIDLKWNRIDTIEFEAAPRSADPGSFRLRGRIATDMGDFEGYIQWDSEECLSSDLLDGESEDGDMSIEFGEIRSIERRGRRSSIIMLKDGREIRLRGSNDVNQENRGIYVEDEGFGRAKVNWDEFDRVEFDDAGDSGRGYDDYGSLGPLQGTVTDEDGERYTGRIVIDLDEAEAWEILNGSDGDIEFNIPLANVASIRPDRRDSSTVRLKNGRELVLEDGQDVSSRNSGVLIFADDDDPVYLRWDEVEEIELD